MQAVVATTPNDSHSWNLVYLELLLADQYVGVHGLGPCTPVTRILETLRDFEVDLLVLSSVNGHGISAIADTVLQVRASAHGRDVPIAVGGKLDTSGGPSRDAIKLLTTNGVDRVFTGESAVAQFLVWMNQLPEGASLSRNRARHA